MRSAGRRRKRFFPRSGRSRRRGRIHPAWLQLCPIPVPPRSHVAAVHIIAISDRMPEIGREFYETGPAEGVTKLCHYLESQGVAGILTIEDCEVAAAQFLDSCVATILKPLLFNASEAPSDERI